MLFLNGDCNVVTVELESSASTSDDLEVSLSGICELPRDSQMMMTIVRNVEKAVVILRSQCCNEDVSIVHCYASRTRESLPLRRPFPRPDLAWLEELDPELNLETVWVVLLPCRAM